ncbi:MAG: hypothetical protein IJQ32_06785 [Paludibacteraceae bacterium]|nr:hypothetical protein [Paludibacteraceae bacterium]
MTALQLNAELYRNLGIIAENETMFEKVVKYVRNLAKKIQEDPTCMTKEEYFRRLDEAEKGPTYRMLPNETMDEMLTRLGYV